MSRRETVENEGGSRLSPATHRRLRSFPLLLCTAVLVVAGDQALKALVSATLEGGRIVELFGGSLRFDYTSNTGAAFGFFRAGGVLFALIAAGVCALIVLYSSRLSDSPALTRVAFGLILGGAAGNLIDRIRLGYVVDFIDLRWWPVFNLADSMVFVGVCLLILNTFLQPDTSNGR